MALIMYQGHCKMDDKEERKEGTEMRQDFKAFITRGNVIDMAVGIIIGVAFAGVINSLVKDVISPPVGLALGNVDFANLFAVLKEGVTPGPYASLAAAQEAGAVTINYGVFINAIVNFLIIAAAVFFLIVRPVARMQARKKAEAPPPTTKECPFCITAIPIKATRCPNCTSELKTA
jgi:large conductance mechanosensitive channel